MLSSTLHISARHYAAYRAYKLKNQKGRPADHLEMTFQLMREEAGKIATRISTAVGNLDARVCSLILLARLGLLDSAVYRSAIAEAITAQIMRSDATIQDFFTIFKLEPKYTTAADNVTPRTKQQQQRDFLQAHILRLDLYEIGKFFHKHGLDLDQNAGLRAEKSVYGHYYIRVLMQDLGIDLFATDKKPQLSGKASPPELFGRAAAILKVTGHSAEEAMTVLKPDAESAVRAIFDGTVEADEVIAPVPLTSNEYKLANDTLRIHGMGTPEMVHVMRSMATATTLARGPR